LTSDGKGSHSCAESRFEVEAGRRWQLPSCSLKFWRVARNVLPAQTRAIASCTGWKRVDAYDAADGCGADQYHPIPAHFEDNRPFEGSGWDGPAYVITFTDSQPTDQVFDFFAQLAARSDWHVDKYSSRNLPIQWSRAYPGGGRAVVSLLPTNRWESRSNDYTLRGSIT
jgi:hypothetical protein